jgi:Trypsin/Secretion system C-terminal sorting domain/Immunoglobulin domain/PKD-like domain
MRRILLISLLYLISFAVLAQKAAMKVSLTKNPGLTAWQIIDDQKTIIFSGNEFLQNDSVAFSLDENKHYYLEVSVSGNVNPELSLLTLYLNTEPILFLRPDIGTGDHIFPFYTGVKALNAKITGGTNTVISDFPWQIYYISGNFRCGGSIISNRWVVTAAHCTFNSTGGSIPASQMFVRVGLNDPSNATEGKTYAVSEAIVNAGFDSQTLLNDIALLRLQDTINFANAIPINLVTTDDAASGFTDPGVLSWVTGWGLTQVSPQVLPTALQKVQLPIISTAQAATVWGGLIQATDMMAGYLNGNKDACNGDSGGPLVVPVLGQYKLAGIVSWGSSACNTYGAYTRVSDMESWIRTNTGIARNFTPPAPAGDSVICQGTESSQYSIAPVTGATAYSWQLLPANAGTITGNAQNASVLWNISFTGSVSIILKVTVNNKLSDPSGIMANVVNNTKIVSQSADTVICDGQPVTLKIITEGYNLSYKWFKNNQPIQAANSPNLSFSAATINDSGDYNCEITGSCGTVVSGYTRLNVYPLTKITHLSPSTEVPFGNDVILSVTAEGHDLVYQWQKDGTLIDNSNTSDLLLSNLNATNIGIYRTTVTGTCGMVKSDSIYVYVQKKNFKSDPEVFVWPTITSDQFTVALNNDTLYNVQIFNTAGKKVIELTDCRYQTAVNVRTLAKGVYIVEVSYGDFRRAVKVIRD